MRGQELLIESMSPPRKCRSSQIVAKDGYAASGKCGRDLDKEKNVSPSGLLKGKRYIRYAVLCRPTMS